MITHSMKFSISKLQIKIKSAVKKYLMFPYSFTIMTSYLFNQMNFNVTIPKRNQHFVIALNTLSLFFESFNSNIEL